MEQVEGKVIIFTAPSGAGKTTLVRYLLSEMDCLAFSVSATTRTPRSHEVNGDDYYFMDREDFISDVEAGRFLEWEEVYDGNFYGTLNTEIERIWKQGKTVIFDVDVKGALHLKSHFWKEALAIFVQPPSIDVLIDRLKNRGTESEESLKRRIERFRLELSYSPKFDAQVLNDDLDIAKEKALELVSSFLKK
ncbi:guanylate kinase [Chitinophagales bacterium]|nr:guanylate kinase [Chitinophagales bacterium]